MSMQHQEQRSPALRISTSRPPAPSGLSVYETIIFIYNTGMAKVVHFHEALERDLSRLSSEVKERREKPELQHLTEREVVRQSIEAMREPVQGTEPEEPKPAGNPEPPEESSVLPKYLETSPEPQVELEVEKLIDMVFHDGIERALKESKRHAPFVQDAFHDSLVDRLLPELKKRGVIPS